MLPANKLKIIHCLQRSFNVSKRSVTSGLFPLTEPLEDDDTVPVRKSRCGDVLITKLVNGIKVASCDHGGAVSKVAVALKAGSRFESRSQLGLCHVIKNAAFITNENRTALRTIRETQQLGGALECSSSREVVSWKGVALRTHLPELLENIAPSISSPEFNVWDLGEVRKLCKGDLARLDCTAKNMELLHEAAYRTGLGNSVYISEPLLDNYSTEHLIEFARKFYVGNNLTIVGTDVNHDELVSYSKDLLGGLTSGALDLPSIQQYHGGELRVNTSNRLTHASLVGPGAGLCSADLPAFAILQKILGEPTSIKWGSNTVSSRLNRAAKEATKDPFLISSLNVSYSDAGLFGLHAVSTPSAISSVLKGAFKEVLAISNGEISSEDLDHAKNQVKSNVLMLSEGGDGLIDDIVKQVAFTGEYLNQAQTLDTIDAVTLEQVLEIANKVFSAKTTLAVTGDCSDVPFVDELS